MQPTGSPQRPQWTYLGPEGTFTEQAAQALASGESLAPQLIPATDLSAAVAAVRSGSVQRAVVPLENSVEGAVALAQDELIHGGDLQIYGEAYVAVRFELLVRPGTDPAQVRRIGSHPHGHAQVRDYLAAHFPQAEAVVTTSTAAAAQAVAAGELDAAAAAAIAGRRNGLTALAGDIGLSSDAVTRFALLGSPGPVPPPSDNDRTSLVAHVPNQPGTLLAVLAEIADRGVNLTRLESRPTREVMGEYLFLLDADGHVDQPAMAATVAALRGRGSLFRFLGSYPKADRR